MRLYNPTTFISGTRLLRRTSDLPLYADEGSMKSWGEYPPASSRRQVITDADGWADFLFLLQQIRAALPGVTRLFFCHLVIVYSFFDDKSLIY